MKAILIALGVVVGIAVVSIGMTKYNYAIQTENDIVYSWQNLENIKSSYTMKVKEMAQVPDMYADKLKEVVSAAIGGRYGADGSKATWQWIKEQNPTLDPSMYIRLQQVMEAGRNDFQQAQTIHLDKLRAYQSSLKTMPDAIVYGMFQFPKIDLNKYNIIISSDTKKQFETGTDEVLKLK